MGLDHRLVARWRWLSCLIAICVVVVLAPCYVRAQVYGVTYRPSGVHYWQVQSDHFTIIYQDGLLGEAREMATILEGTLPDAADLVGLQRPLRMPVVLNGFNDRSNGYVTPLPFKQEIEGVGIKGDALSPRFSNWLETVSPHELTHAVHAESGTGFGVGMVLRWFAPDAARTLNLDAPAGINEGLAVYRESILQPGAGRLHHSLFEMRFRASMGSHHPWSLTQMVERPAYTRPFNRYYVGGANLFEYMAEQDRLDFFQRARNAYYRFPFLGYGIALWYGARMAPHRLSRHVRDYFRREEAQRIAALGPLTPARAVSSKRGLRHRRPRWVDDETLVVYADGYDLRPGFYRIDAATGRRSAAAYQRITEDFYFSLAPDASRLYYARYVPDAFSFVQAIAELQSVDLSSGDVHVLTHGGRVLAPVPAPGGGLWALQNDGQYNQWVHVDAAGRITPFTNYRRAIFKSIHPSPDGETVAVLLNVDGRQGIFRARFDHGMVVALTPWIGFAHASIYDVAWSADGRYLLFSADPSGVTNAYAYDTQRERLARLTNVAYGAIEPALSPDGQTLAFVEYQDERWDLMTMPFDPDNAPEVPLGETAAFTDLPFDTWLSASPVDTVAVTEPERYRAFDHLSPRVVTPTFRYDPPSDGGADTNLGLGVGLAVAGVDPLERWSYEGEAFFQNQDLWGTFTARTARTRLRPFVQVFDVPSTTVARRVDEQGAFVDFVTVGREARGVGAGVSLPVLLSSNVYATSLNVGLTGELREERLFDDDADALTPFAGRFTLRPSAVLNYRIQANARDLVPSTGLALSSFSRVDVAEENGRPSRWWYNQINLYVPLLRGINGGLRLHLSALSQNDGSTLDTDFFLPRGYEDRSIFLGSGTFLRYGVEYTQPFWYPDDGFLLVPLYFKAFYAFGFAETMQPYDDFSAGARLSSAGAGLGVLFRFAHVFDLSLKVGAAYLIDDGAWEVTYR